MVSLLLSVEHYFILNQRKFCSCTVMLLNLQNKNKYAKYIFDMYKFKNIHLLTTELSEYSIPTIFKSKGFNEIDCRRMCFIDHCDNVIDFEFMDEREDPALCWETFWEVLDS